MTKHAYDDFKNGHEILCNYKLYFKSVMMSPYDMLKIPFLNVDRDFKTLVIQEADKWFDSRRSMRNENVLLSSLTGQSGKRNLNIYYDTQYPNRVDMSLRDVTDYIYEYLVFVDTKTRNALAFQYTLMDGEENPIVVLPPIPASYLEPYYHLYNSYEATQPLTVGKSMKELREMFSPNAKPKSNTKQKAD